MKGRETRTLKGYAFCICSDAFVTSVACAAVRRANHGTAQPKQEITSQQILLQLMFQPGELPTKVVCITQAVTADDLADDEEYHDILVDMKEEGEKFGSLVNIIIPRPGPNGELAPGVGKVFLEYADTDSSSKARTGLNGRKFGRNQVVTVFYLENKFAEGDYDG